jgi:hypothetical protein
MSILDIGLFASSTPTTVGVGFHNVGSGVLRASNETMVKYVEHHYGERCGHIPLDAGNIGVLVDQHTTDLHTHMDYLGRLFGKTIAPQTLDELRVEKEKNAAPAPIVVPSSMFPDRGYLLDALGAHGDYPEYTHALKNKNFYKLAAEFGPKVADYTVTNIYDLNRQQPFFRVEELYKQTG